MRRFSAKCRCRSMAWRCGAGRLRHLLLGADKDRDAGSMKKIRDATGAPQQASPWKLISRHIDQDFLGVHFGRLLLGHRSRFKGLRGLPDGEFAQRDQRRLLKKAFGFQSWPVREGR